VYTKVHKTAALGVAKDLLKAHGSVNAKVAEQLVKGALERSAPDLAVAVCGVLGPDADEDGNPPGQVYFAGGPQRTGCSSIESMFQPGKPG
jgi:PncC family amidohydrolase